jgi:alcohol dehydrogenase YqhD (iron-dependent ADH family)
LRLAKRDGAAGRAALVAFWGSALPPALSDIDLGTRAGVAQLLRTLRGDTSLVELARRSLAHPLSAELGLHHGLANALCLPAVLDFNRSAVPERISRIAKLMGVRADDVETLAFECSGAVRALRKKIGIPEGLGAAGVKEEDLPRLAALAVEDVAHQLNPRPCTEDDMLALYRASM